MKKTTVIVTTLALIIALSTGVLARGNYGLRNSGYLMMNGSSIGFGNGFGSCH